MLRNAGSGGRRFPSYLFLILMNLVSVACLVWVLHDMNLASLWRDIAHIHWGWVAVAVFFDVSVYVWQGYRWSLLLAPVAAVPIWQSVRAIYVGLFANEVLPFRSGEIIRCYLQSRWSGLPFPVTLSSALIERIFDGIWLVFLLFLTTRIVTLPRFLVDGGTILGIILLMAAAILVVVMFSKQHAHRAMGNSRWLMKLRVLIDDLHAMGNSASFYKAALASLPYMLLQVMPIYALLHGYGLDLSLGAAFAITIILRLGTVVPQAPGNLGTFQALVVLSLTLFAVETAAAKRFSVILWGVITLPLLIAGFIALLITGAKLRDLQREARATAEAQPAVRESPTRI